MLIAGIELRDRQLREKMETREKMESLQILEMQFKKDLDRIKWKSYVRSKRDRGKKLKITKI